jgi:hypothetical protein
MELVKRGLFIFSFALLLGCSEDRFSDDELSEDIYDGFSPTVTPFDLSSNTEQSAFCFYENNFVRVLASNPNITAFEWSKIVDGDSLYLSSEPTLELATDGNFKVRLEYGIEYEIVRYFSLSYCPTSIEFPSVFTPSNQNFSRWRPIEQGIQDWAYKIEDAEGVVVYESQTPDEMGWNGFLPNGIEAPAGTYNFSFYGLFKTGRTKAESGSFVLVR